MKKKMVGKNNDFTVKNIEIEKLISPCDSIIRDNAACSARRAE